MSQDRTTRGELAYAQGHAAEQSVEKYYLARGATTLERRWRGSGGEIDLIFRQGDVVVCVEVKSSSNFEAAAASLSERQVHRLLLAAEEFCGTLPKGSLTPLRFDVALVDRRGSVRVLEAAITA